MKPRETEDEGMQRADTQIPLRSSSPASSEAQPDHCRKDVQKVGSQRHSQWHPLSKHRESHPQCMQYPPKEELGRKEQHMEERKMGKKGECLQKATQTLFGRREKGGLKKDQTLFNHQVDLSISKVKSSV